MKACIIFCAAEFDELLSPIEKEDYILAADGGLRHLQKLGMRPDGIIGDFDSLGFVPEDAEVFPVEKDDTDAMLAARKGLELGFRNFLFYGSLDGPRLDHTLANFQTLLFLADRGARGYLVGRDYLVTVIREEKVTFSGDCTGILSLFCLGCDATGISIRGAQYELEDGALSASFPLGVSNHFVSTEVTVEVKNGNLLALWDRKNGLPTRSIPEGMLC